MTKFNKQWVQVVGVLMLMASLISCVKADKHNLDVENGKGPRSFRVSRSGDPIDLTGYAPNLITSGDAVLDKVRDVSVQSADARYPNRREYTFQMCGLADLRSQGNILGMKMKIYSELDLLNTEVEIQNNSCVTWLASVPFNYFGDAVNLKVNFIFMTVRDPKAYIRKTVIINPWDKRRGDNPEFADVTRSGISPYLQKLPAAEGPEEIELALQGKFTNTKKVLEIGSVNIVPVQKNKQNFIETNLIGTDISASLEQKNKNEDLRMKLNNNMELQSLDLHFNVRLSNLKVRLFDSSQKNSDEELTTGRYRIYAQMIATDQAQKGHFIISDRVIISNEKEWSTTTMGVNAVLPISLVIRPQWGNLNLLLKVVPVDIPGVEAFEGLYHLGRFDEIAGGKSPLFDLSEYTPIKKESKDYTFSYDEYLKKAKNFSDWEKNLAENAADDVSTFEKGFRRFMFTQLDVLFSRVMPGDTSTDRTIQYTVETCVTDNFTGARPGAGLKFEIETEDRGVKYKTLRQTNDLGCLTWVGMISHMYYHRENLVPKYSKLTYLGEDSNKPEYTLDYYINPWDEKFTFGRDARRLTPEYLKQIEETQKVAPPTRVLITDFSYDATGFRYVIDRYMNMTVKKTVLMTIKPMILKYNSIVWGRSGLSEIRDGIYLMKVAMQKDYLDPMANKGVVVTDQPYPQKRNGDNLQTMSQEEAENIEKKQFLVVKETLVRVLGGKIVTPIEFEINDLRTLRIRSQMLIQIETIDEMLLRAALLANEKLNGLVKAGESKQTQEIMALQSNLDELSKQIEEAKTASDLTQMDQYLKLLAKDDELTKRMQKMLSTLDRDSVNKLLAQIEEIRRAGETAVSVDRNIKFRTLNQALVSLGAKIKKAQAKQEKAVEEQVRIDKLAECKYIMSDLINRGKVDDAALYDPKNADTDNNLCKTKISNEEMFYYLTSSSQVGSDAWFESMLTKDEFDLYKSNLLRDDFTKPYPPDFDFRLLSNQGDERFFDNGEPREGTDQSISGLPRRTFIGPVTFVLNGNGSAMRPTDVLDESGCNGTCETLGEVESEIINKTEAAQEEIRKFGLPVNSAYEKSPYFGSVEHFYKKQVDDLIPMYRGLKYQYHQEMKAFSQVGNFLEQFHLKYVSFGKQRHIKKLDYNCYAEWKSQNEETYRKWRSGEDVSYKVVPMSDKCFVNSDRVFTKQQFSKIGDYQNRAAFSPEMKRLNSYSAIDVSEANLKEYSKNGLMSTKLNFETKISILHKMCYMLRTQLYPQDKGFEKTVNDRVKKTILSSIAKINYYYEYVKKADDIQTNCHNLVDIYSKDVAKIIKGTTDVHTINAVMALKSAQLPLVTERRVRILETSNKYLYKDGKTLNYSVGTGFSTGHSMNANRGYKMDPLEVIEKGAGGATALLGGATSLLAGAGKLVSSVLGSVTGMVNFQWGVGESLSVSDGTSVGENTTLAAQISTLDIELSKWEKCTVVRFEENFLKQEMNNNYGAATFINPTKDIQALGFFICSGDTDTEDDMNPGEKLRVRERYFYLTQIFNEGDMQDSGALANHPWMLQLRGMRDFGRFEKALKTPMKDVSWYSALEYMSRDLYSAIQLGGDIRHNDTSSMEVVNRDDVAKALDLMSVSFDRVMPTFPGMYTYSDTVYDKVVGWPKK
jgi:hypothetical protein